MLKLLGKVPNTVNIAFSGGSDSVVCTDFLLRRKRNIRLLYFDHGTEHGKEAKQFCIEYASQQNIPIHIGECFYPKSEKESLEEYWRKQRYLYFSSWEDPVISCHHLNDVLETWVFTSMHGIPKLIPYRHGNVIRPFLLNTKTHITEWAITNNLHWLEDPSNLDVKHPRNRIRHNIVPEILKINPGIYKTLIKKLKKNQ